MHHRAIAKERSHHVQALATRGLNAVLLATHGPGAAVGVNLRKADLIEVGQTDLTGLRLRPQGFDLLSTALKGGVISFF